MVTRGPTFSSHFPANAADSPKNRIARLNIQPSVVSFQSSGKDSVTPNTLVNGKLKTLKA